MAEGMAGGGCSRIALWISARPHDVNLAFPTGRGGSEEAPHRFDDQLGPGGCGGGAPNPLAAREGYRLSWAKPRSFQVPQNPFRCELSPDRLPA